MSELRCGRFVLPMDRPLIMGIVNLTPDSFSGDGLANDTERAIAHAHHQIAAGADMLVLGAESSRPGAIPTSLEDELARLLPVLKALQGCGVPISVDTYKPEVMNESIRAGAHLINDICALQEPGALSAVAESGVPVCLMHMQGKPRTMQQAPHYNDLCGEVYAFFQDRINTALMAEIGRAHV